MLPAGEALAKRTPNPEDNAMSGKDRPHVVLHNAISADGRITGFEADQALYYRLAGTWNEDATLVGADTFLAVPGPFPDEDHHTFEPPFEIGTDNRPLLVVPDSRGRLRIWHYLKSLPFWREGISLCSAATPPEHRAYLRERHIHAIEAGADHVDLAHALAILKSEFLVNTVRVDSGGTLNGALLRAGLVDEMSLLVSPCLAGGIPNGIFREPALPAGAGPIRLELMEAQKLEQGHLWVRYRIASVQ
ncbi:MAG: RibD family protein [Spirochaetes bacterium]|nr:MAG: RibD family protein [Spirochaetota bacterium]